MRRRGNYLLISSNMRTVGDQILDISFSLHTLVINSRAVADLGFLREGAKLSIGSLKQGSGKHSPQKLWMFGF